MAGPIPASAFGLWRQTGQTDQNQLIAGTIVGTWDDAGSDLVLPTNGLTVTAGGVTIPAGVLTVTADGLTVTAGDLTVTAGDAIVTVGNVDMVAGTLDLQDGGTITQMTDKTTGVTLSTNSGQITMDNADLTTGAEATFIVTNTLVAATDVVVVNHGSVGTAGTYVVWCSNVGAGVYSISVSNLTGGTLSEAIVLNVAIIHGAAS